MANDDDKTLNQILLFSDDKKFSEFNLQKIHRYEFKSI